MVRRKRVKKNKFKYKLYVLTLMNALLLAGCTQIDKSTAFSVNIDGEKVYFDKGSEKDKEADKINEMISGFVKEAMVADYTNFDKLAQFEYYAAADKAALLNNGNHLILENYVLENELISKLEKYTLDEIYIYERNGVEQAHVVCTYIITLVNGTEDYCIATNQEIGKSYKKSITMKLSKEEGLWKIHYELIHSPTKEVTLENE